MSVAYVDTSALAAIVFDEPGAASLAGQLDGFERLVSSNLLEAELRAAFVRESQSFEVRAVSGIQWVLPDRSLTREFETVLQAGYLRGADLWHVATALYLSPEPVGLTFATLDARQAAIAGSLGFRILRES